MVNFETLNRSLKNFFRKKINYDKKKKIQFHKITDF